MKNTISILTALLLVISLIGCSNDGSVDASDTVAGESNSTTFPNTNEATDHPVPAQTAYQLLTDTADLCSAGVAIIHDAWDFGVYTAPDLTSATVFDKLAEATGLDADFLEDHSEYDALYLVKGDGDHAAFDYCLWAVESYFTANGVYDEVKAQLEEAKTLIRSLPSDRQTDDLKTLHAKVSAYADFFQSVQGSLKELPDQKKAFEKAIDEAREPLRFDLE